jgi:hypothetical protein
VISQTPATQVAPYVVVVQKREDAWGYL